MARLQESALRSGIVVALWAVVSFGCSARYEAALGRDLSNARQTLAPEGETVAEAPDGSLASYATYAMVESPRLRATYERWRAATLRISSARRLPEPMVTYAFYALPVQTRVGPQQHRVSARQSFPWPTGLSAAADAQSARARAVQQRFEAQALGLRRRVANAWWSLWLIRQTREIEREQLEILDGLSASVRARVETSRASIADLTQVDLTRSRMDDHITALDEAEASAEAALRGAISAPHDLPMPTPVEVTGLARPTEDRDALAEAVRAHPFLRSFDFLAEADEAQAQALEARRFPRFTLGVDWIQTGDLQNPMPGQASGDDALIASVGLSVPLWQESYDDMQRSAEAEAAADRADREEAENAALTEMAQAVIEIRDSHRRVRLFRDTLLPQALTAYESVVGAYAVGEASVAATLIAQRALLELSVGLVRARAEHGRGWARLERVVGRPVEAAVEASVEASVEAPVDEAAIDEATAETAEEPDAPITTPDAADE